MKRKPPIVIRSVPARGQPNPDEQHDRELFEQAMVKLDSAALKTALREKGSSPAQSNHGARFVRSLERGTVGPTSTIDLHGHDRQQAGLRLASFIAQRSPAEVVLIIHGKGDGILARLVDEFLDGSNRIAEHLAAPARLGGQGARVARLKGRRP